MSRLVVLLVLAIGCSGEASPAPALACKADAVVDDRLVVSCNADVSPVPDACELAAEHTYRCNWLHANAEQCAAFPGICQ
jgi:hypothetical protein